LDEEENTIDIRIGDEVNSGKSRKPFFFFFQKRRALMYVLLPSGYRYGGIGVGGGRK
jgi:hypothetical protein